MKEITITKNKNKNPWNGTHEPPLFFSGNENIESEWDEKQDKML